MKFKSVTIKDIAKALSISKSTVARAFKDASDVSPATKTRVLEYAEKIHYRPSPAALNLKQGQSLSIGVVVSEVANTFFSEAIDGIESVAFNKGYSVIITQSHESHQREKANVVELCNHSIEGLLISLSCLTSDLSYLKEWQQKGLPIVLFDKISDDIETHKVKFDNYKSAFEATEQLIVQGYQKICHITALPFVSITKERLNGYKAALEKYNLPFKEDWVVHCKHENTTEEVEQALKLLLNCDDGPDAIFTASERTTIATFCLLSMLQPHKTLGFAGFSNNDLFNSLASKEIIIRQPAYEIGKLATELLFDIIESDAPNKNFETKVLQAEVLNKKYGNVIKT
jgi:LacI family transcriptional regulator